MAQPAGSLGPDRSREAWRLARPERAEWAGSAGFVDVVFCVFSLDCPIAMTVTNVVVKCWYKT